MDPLDEEGFEEGKIGSQEDNEYYGSGPERYFE